MNDLIKTIAIALVVSLIVVLTLSGYSKQTFGAVGAGITNLSGLSVSGNPGTFDVSSNVTTGGNIIVTPDVGCVQMYATSTATALKMNFVASTTAPTNTGVISVVSYGTCP